MKVPGDNGIGVCNGVRTSIHLVNCIHTIEISAYSWIDKVGKIMCLFEGTCYTRLVVKWFLLARALTNLGRAFRVLVIRGLVCGRATPVQRGHLVYICMASQCVSPFTATLCTRTEGVVFLSLWGCVRFASSKVSPEISGAI